MHPCHQLHIELYIDASLSEDSGESNMTSITPPFYQQPKVSGKVVALAHYTFPIESMY